MDWWEVNGGRTGGSAAAGGSFEDGFHAMESEGFSGFTEAIGEERSPGRAAELTFP